MEAGRSRSSTTATCQRDFTYIDDIVEGTLRVLDQPAPMRSTTSATTAGAASGLHCGAGACARKKAKIEMKPMQPPT